MSNKTQLQTNNTALDGYIARINAAKEVADSLPEAGGSGGSGGGNFVIETATVTFINTNEDNDYDIMGTWVEGNYITSYDTSVYCDDTKEKVALKQSHITIKPSIVKSISGNCVNYGDYTGARILYINGDCTITLQ